MTYRYTSAFATVLAAACALVACTNADQAPTLISAPTHTLVPTSTPFAVIPTTATPHPPTPSPVPTATPTQAPSPTPNSARTPVPKPTPTVAPSPAATTTPQLTPMVEPTRSPTPTPTPTVAPTQTPWPTASPTATQTQSPIPTLEPSPTPTPTRTPTATPTPTAIPFPSPTPFPTPDPNLPPQTRALIALYDATGGPNWRVNTNWRTDAPIDTWHGVQTDADGNVIGLDLTYNDLSGRLPAAIGQLTRLQRLSLAINSLTGNIPAEIGNLTQLQFLDLSNNELTGSIPPQIGNLANVTQLLLGYNDLTGPISPEISDMTQLGSLSLQGNRLSGQIPPQLATISSLYGIDLAANQLTGNIPTELAQLPFLAYLDISNNAMSGNTSEWPSGLDTLSQFRISDNNFSGCVPANLRDIIDTDVVFSTHSYCGDPPNQSPVSPDFVTWLVGDDVIASEERTARAGLQWLIDYAHSVNWPMAQEPFTIYLDQDFGLARVLAEDDGIVEPGEIDVHLGFVRSTNGFADDDANYNRATQPDEPVNHSKTLDTVIHENIHIMFQRDIAGLNTTQHGEWSAPLWWTEGMAKLFTEIVAGTNYSTSIADRRRFLVEAADVERCDVPLAQLEDPQTYDLFLCGYDMGALAVELLGSIIGFQNITDIYTERQSGWTWHQTWNSVFTITLDDFYTRFAEHHATNFPAVPHPVTAP